MMERFEKHMNTLRRKLSFVFGDHVSFSYPVPAMVNGRRTERMFMSRRGIHSPESTRPFAVITLDPETGDLLAFVDARAEDFAGERGDPVGTKISYALPEQINVKTYQARQAEIRALYEEIRPAVFSGMPSDTDLEKIMTYLRRVRESVPAALIPYYEALSGSLEAWLDQA